MITRRDFLKMNALAGTGLVIPGLLSGGSRLTPLLAAQAIPRWAQAFPRPPAFTPAGILDGTTYYEIPIAPGQAQILPNGPPTAIWGYGGTYPGASFETVVGDPIKVKWYNSGLPANHLLPVDPTLHGTDMGEPEVRTVTHLHGGHVASDSDGYPEAWFDYQGNPATPHRPGRPLPQLVYTYPNAQEGATLWYHDHALGITRLNVYAGLAGFYLLRDAAESWLNLPGNGTTDDPRYEIPIVLQDRTFNADGSLFYPHMGMNSVNPIWVPEFFGDVSVVNGKAWPFHEVEPRKYRLRLLNGSNSRFYNIQFYGRTPSGRLGSSGPAMVQIGTDGGFLPGPVNISIARSNNSGRLLLGPGERADVIVDFSRFAGQTLVLHNNAPTPFSGRASAPGGWVPHPGPRHFVGGTVPLDELLEFRVGPGPVTDPSVIPAALPTSYTPPVAPAGTVVRDFDLIELMDPVTETPLTSLVRNSGTQLQMWTEPMNTAPIAAGSQEVWRFINITADTHPMHVHLVQFKVMWRRAFNVTRYENTGAILWTGPEVPPDPNERGWKDTVRANPGEVTAVLVDFTINFIGDLGYYPTHCHILEHEDHEMMREYLVL
jgi:spore coat protein A, manganese oxidase